MTTSTHEITVGGDRIAFKVTSEQSAGEVAVLDVTIPAGGGPPMLHRHDPFELYRVRSGELAIYLEGKDGSVKRRVAGPGAVVPIAGGLEHTVRNESDEDAEAVVVFSPGEPMERFARAAGEITSHEELLGLAQAYGIEITRPIDAAVRESAAAYLTIARFSGDGDRFLEQYRESSAVMSGVGRDHGLILHAAAKTDDGFMVVNLWPSKEESEAAAHDPRRLTVLERTGLRPDQIQREHHDVTDYEVFD
jgi:mannose-6-phosphate isomerase-like protein (cupin superfamily)